MYDRVTSFFINQLRRLSSNETGRSYWDIIRTNLFGFFNLLLFTVGSILIAFGRYNDAFITIIAGLISALIQTAQEVRAKRQLDQITLLVRPHVTVIRNGVEQTIEAAAITKGDAVHFRVGDQAMADGVVIGDGAAEVNESLLTGESELVRKQPGDGILSGSFCMSGDLVYTAEAVGAESYANRFTALARTLARTSTPIEQQVTVVIRLLMVLTVFMAAIFLIGGLLDRSSLSQYVSASAVLVGIVPYGLFLTMSASYSLSALNLAKAGAIFQHTRAVESLTQVDVLCTDKTGTLTTNALLLQTVLPFGEMPEAGLQVSLGDFVRSASTTNATTAAVRQRVTGRKRVPVDEVPFASARRWSAVAFDDSGGRGVFVLGARESLSPHLATDALGQPLARQERAWSEQGLRVLLFAHNPDVVTLHDATGEPQLPPLHPLGLISLSDELRPQAREMLNHFSEMGVRLKIISGDSPHTVAALARQLGVADPQLVSGQELAAMNETAFAQAAEEATVFGRVSPEQKAQLIESLVQHGHYPAMIGDGVNDILALKRARLGIAMQDGSNAARNVADIILVNDSYGVLVPALAESRRVINGLTNATYLIIARSITYAFVIMGVLMVGLGFPFEPAQTAVTAITVGLPSFALIFWARPHKGTESLLTSLVRFVLPVALWSMLIGVAIFSFVHFRFTEFFQNVYQPPGAIARFEQYTGLVFATEHEAGLTAARILAQTALSVFLSLSSFILLAFLEPPAAPLASWRDVSPDRRPAQLAAALAALLITGLYVPAIADYLGFIPLPPGLWGIILGGLVIWTLGLRLFWRRRWMDKLLSLDG